MMLLSLTDWLAPLDYINVTILMTIESSFIPFPSEVVIPPAAFMAAEEGNMTLWGIILFASLGSLIGATINYYLAYYIGRPIVYKFAASKVGRLCLLSPAKLEKAEGYFARHGAIATLVGRLLPAIRQLISIPAGLARMNIGKFLCYTFIGAGAWNVVLAMLGWSLHSVMTKNELVETVRRYEQPIIWGIIGAVVVALAVVIIKAVRDEKRQQRQQS